MSELINNAEERRKLLKHMITQLHDGVAPDQVKRRIADLLHDIPYGDVVAVEQELIAEGLPEEDILKLCDLHHQVLDGNLKPSEREATPPGHPVDTFIKENTRIREVCEHVGLLLSQTSDIEEPELFKHKLLSGLNDLMDVDKHYQRKENLLFPYLEKHQVTGPPKVMWGKHDEIRELLKGSIAGLREAGNADEISGVCELAVAPAVEALIGMTMKEEQILLPMCMDLLSVTDWYDIYLQTDEIGYCLYDPQDEWHPEGSRAESKSAQEGSGIRLSSGSFTLEELENMLNVLPVDITFVDRTDKVKYFSQGVERIFHRSRAILGRDVRMCHPASSVHVVEQIVEDFKAGRQDCAPFWIQLKGKFIHIAYYALRNAAGDYLGTVEMSQDLTPLRALEGEQRILSYDQKQENATS